MKNDGKWEEKRNKKGWWNEEYRERKRKVRRELRKWREGGKGDRYRLLKKEYKELCEEKKKEEKERIIREVGKTKTEGKVWELVNRERKSRKRINETIELEVWKEYFMGLLGGVEKSAVKKMEREEGRGEKEVELEEVKGVIGRLKNGKALGMDGIPNVLWRGRDEELSMRDMQEGVERGGLARTMERGRDCTNNKKGRWRKGRKL